MHRRTDPAPAITRNALTVELERRDAVTLNSAAICEALRFYDCDVNVQAASQIMMQSLLSGGIHFQHKGRQVDAHEDAWMSSVWCDCMRAAARCAWSVGFFGVVAARHEEFGAQPRVLDLESLDIDMLQDDTGLCQFFAYSRLNRDFGGFVGALARGRESEPIEGIEWFVVKAPTRGGDLRALVSTLWSDYALELATIEASVKADRARAESIIVTEPQMEKPNGNRLPQPWDTPSLLSQAQGSQLKPDDYGSAVNTLDAYKQANDMALSRYINTDAALGMTAVSKADMLAQQRRQARSHSSPYQPVEIKLEENQRLARQVMPEAPPQLIQLRVERQQRVFMSFGVPLSMAADDRKRKTAVQGGAKGASASQADDIFLNAQKALHRQMLLWVRQMYRTTMLQRDVGHLMKTHKKAHAFDAQVILKAAMPDVIIASLPDESAIDKLYSIGALKYEAFKDFYSQKHGIPLSSFADKARPPIIEYEAPKPQAAAKPKAKQ